MRALLLAVVLLVGQSGAVMAHDLEWNELLFASLKLRPGLDYDANVDSYMQVFRPDVWKRYRNDEFEMASKRRETIELMKQAVASFRLEEDFVVRTTTRIGSYDFKLQKFPLEGLTESTYFYASNYPHGSFPSSIKVFMENTDILKEIPMNENQARDFVRGRIGRDGDSDRRVYVTLNLRITRAKSDADSLLSEISKFSIYADSGYTKLLYSFDQKKAQEAAKIAAKQATELAAAGTTPKSAQ